VTYKYDGVHEKKETVVKEEIKKEVRKEEVMEVPKEVVGHTHEPNIVTIAPGAPAEVIKKTTTTTTIDPPDHHHRHQDLAVMVPRHQSEHDIRREIRALEAEAEALRLERRIDKDEDWETERRGKKDIYRVERNRKGRMALIRSTH
jgi:hypothetical protein